jgi:hypothetical protein
MSEGVGATEIPALYRHAHDTIWASIDLFGFEQADALKFGRRRWTFTISRSLIAFLALISTVLDDTLYLSG